MKSQAWLSSDIDTFLKEGSDRTLKTLSVGEVSLSCSSGMRTSGSRRRSTTSSSATTKSSSKASLLQQDHETHQLDIVFENPHADPDELKARKVADALVLYKLCELGDWASIRTWLDANTANTERKREAIVVQGPNQATSLHALCSHKDPPLYLVYQFATIAPEACRMTDFAGRLAIHHAVISVSDPRVADVLAKAYPDSLMVKDRTGLLPINKVRSSPGDKEKPSSLKKKKHRHRKDKTGDEQKRKNRQTN
jgi:hypothetical protein